jgi:ABC-type nitrate/sulfonate/bicarbonate transport system permease component
MKQSHWLGNFNYRPLIVIAVLILAWQYAMSGKFVSDTLAPPGPVAVALIQSIADGSVLQASYETLSAALMGLALGSTIGVCIGIAGGLLRPFARVIHGPVEVMRPLPAIALVPLATMIYGLGMAMEVYVVAFAVVWPTILLTQHAVDNLDRQLLEVADAMQLGRLQRIYKIIVPATLPRLIVMLRFTAAIALLIAVTVELVSNPRGLGNQMMIASYDMVPAKMLAYLAVITAIGWGLNWLLLMAERHSLPGKRRS